ncbi:uncharacterized protein [Antedon mediterranea]|uniref:uncharacterized protein n=1 Tax=Antedon mediterranea TaxID=105859 RepID=UPI003AF6B868
MAGRRKKCPPQLAAVFPVKLGPTEMEINILRSVMHVLCSINRPMSIDDLIVGLLHQRRIRINGCHLRNLFMDYPGLVQVNCNGGMNMCTVLFNVELCTEMFNTKKQICSNGGNCEAIHLCKYFISGVGVCSKNPCKFPHDIYSKHNLPIVKRLFLDDVKPTNLYSRLQEKFARKLDLCEFYDTKKTCKDKVRCQYLHFCRLYMQGKCKYDEGCKLNHDILGENCEVVLARVGVDTKKPLESILCEVRSRLGIEVTDSEEDECTASTDETQHAHLQKKETERGKLDVCGFYNKGATSCRDKYQCKYLHFCRFHMQGKCKYGEDCKFNHDILGENCEVVLDKFAIDTEQDPESILCEVRSRLDIEVTESDEDEYTATTQHAHVQKKAAGRKTLDICVFYNKMATTCNADQCQYLHFCRFHMEGKCKYGEDCKLNHDILGENCEDVLDRVGIDTDQDPESVLYDVRNELDIEVAESEEDECTASSDEIRKSEICSYFIRGHCYSGKFCDKIHHSLPYMWQFAEGSKWTSFRQDEQVIIETEYCKPGKSSTNLKDCDRFVDKQKGRDTAKLKFDDMMIGYCLVRRLSTRESVFTTNSVPFTTNWIWYWKDDDNKWIPYTKEESEIGSDDLEECYQYFLAGKRESTVKFTIFKHHQYVIDFKEMKQTNQIHGKKRIVRRRPHQLVTSSDVEVYNKNWKSKMQRIRVMANPKIGIKDRMLKFPSTWNNCFSELNKDVCLVEVGQDTDEYYSI